MCKIHQSTHQPIGATCVSHFPRRWRCVVLLWGHGARCNGLDRGAWEAPGRSGDPNTGDLSFRFTETRGYMRESLGYCSWIRYAIKKRYQRWLFFRIRFDEKLVKQTLENGIGCDVSVLSVLSLIEGCYFKDSRSTTYENSWQLSLCRHDSILSPLPPPSSLSWWPQPSFSSAAERYCNHL